jgi:hypothetical protein
MDLLRRRLAWLVRFALDRTAFANRLDRFLIVRYIIDGHIRIGEEMSGGGVVVLVKSGS